MKITAQEIRHVADLARLDLSGEEIELLTGQLDDILSYVAKLNELDTDGVEPTSHVIAMVNAFREDEAGSSLSREEALANAPARDEETFIVPRVL